MKKKIHAKLLQGLGLIVLVFLSFRVNFDNIQEAFLLLNAVNVLKILFLIFSLVSLRSLRWKYLVKTLTGQTISFGFSFISVISGIAAGFVFPGRIDTAKPLMLKESFGIDLKIGVSAMTIDRFSDLFSLIIMFIITAIYITVYRNIFNIVYLYFGLGFFVLISFLLLSSDSIFNFFVFWTKKVTSGKFFAKIRSFFIELKKCLSLVKEFTVFTNILILSISGWLIEGLIAYSILDMFGINLNIISSFFIVYFSVFLGLITFIPGGTGINEVSESELIKIISPSTNEGIIITVVLLHRFIAYYLLVFIGSLILLFRLNKKINA